MEVQDAAVLLERERPVTGIVARARRLDPDTAAGDVERSKLLEDLDADDLSDLQGICMAVSRCDLQDARLPRQPCCDGEGVLHVDRAALGGIRIRRIR